MVWELEKDYKAFFSLQNTAETKDNIICLVNYLAMKWWRTSGPGYQEFSSKFSSNITYMLEQCQLLISTFVLLLSQLERKVKCLPSHKLLEKITIQDKKLDSVAAVARLEKKK